MEIRYEFSEDFTKEQMLDVMRNLRNIFRIPRNSIPLSRKLGMGWESLSQISPELENEYATDVVDVVEEFEPRVSVYQVKFEYDNEGMATPTVYLEKGEWENE